MARPHRHLIGGTLLLLVSVLAAYWPSLRAGYVWDDDSYLTQNELIRTPAGLWKLWTQPGAHPQYYPLVFTSYGVEYQLWGLHPLGYHLTNVLLHAGSALLLWLLLRRLGLAGAWPAALVFALHPVMVESVAWITERKNVLSLVFYLLGMHAGVSLLGLSAADAGPASRRQAIGCWLALTACYALALLSKTVTVTLPAALLVLAWQRWGRLRWRDVVLLLPLLLGGLALGLHTAHLERATVGAVGQDWAFTLGQRVVLAGQIVWFYVGKLLHPEPLLFIYPRWSVDISQEMQWLGAVGVMAVLVGLVLLSRRLGRGPAAAGMLFVGTLFPALGFFNVYPMRFSYVADHFQYHASVALIVLVVCGLAHLSRTPGLRRGALLALVLALPMLGWTTHQRCYAYADARTLWMDTLARNRDATIAAYNLGQLELDAGRPANALALFNMAVIARPEQPLAYYNRALGWIGLGQLDAARADLRTAIQLYRGYEPERAAPHRMLGLYALENDAPAAAAQEFSQMIQCQPQRPEGHRLLGQALLRQQQYAPAQAAFEQALAQGDDSAQTQFDLALTLQQQAQYERAITHYEQALARDAEHAQAHANLAVLLAQAQRFAEAVGHQQRALALQPQPAWRHNLLRMHVGYALQLAQRGQVEPAREQLQAALLQAQWLKDATEQARIAALLEKLR